MTHKKRMTTAQKKSAVVSIYDSTLGNVSETCKRANISRNTFYTWVKKDKKFAEKIFDIDESNLDFTETMLLKNVREGKEASIFFHLKTKGKDRGYVERIEQEVNFNPFLELMKVASLVEEE